MSFAQVFFEECSRSLGFLVDERGWHEVQRERTSVSAEVVYLKQGIALEVVLDWRDFDISAYISLWERAQGVWRVDKSGDIVRRRLEEIADRSWFFREEVSLLYMPAKLAKQAQKTRDLGLCRQWFRSELSVLGRVIHDWEEEILTRAQAYLGVPAGSDELDRF